MNSERFFLSAHPAYFPDGGMADYRGAFDSVAKARAALEMPEEDSFAEIACFRQGDLVTVARLVWRNWGWENWDWEKVPPEADSGGSVDG